MRRRFVPSFAVLLAFSSFQSCATPVVRASIDDEGLHVTAHDKPYATVRFAALPRPFVWPLFTANGEAITRAWPMAERDGEERDHPHHQSMWFAHGAVDGFDFWHGKQHGERQELVEFTCDEAGDSVTLCCDYAWRADVDGGVRDVLREKRTIVFMSEQGLRLIFWTSELQPGGDAPVRFGDTKEGTFAVRTHPGMRVDGKRAHGRLLNARGQRDADVWGKRSSWICNTGFLASGTVSLVMMDHPDNPRYPTWWHARTYGLLAANPFGQHDFEGGPEGGGDLVLQPGEKLTFRYAILVKEGEVDARTLNGAFGDWSRYRGEG